MLANKTNKNKNLILGIILGAIILIVGFLLLKSFVFNKGDGSSNEGIESTSFDRPESFKSLESAIFNDPKFKELKDNSAEKIKIEDLNIGRENPFIETK
jgi:hypothetical protein